MLLAIETNVAKFVINFLSPLPCQLRGIPGGCSLGHGADLLNVFFLFRDLIVHLLDLVLQNLQLPLLVFKHLRVNVDFTL